MFGHILLLLDQSAEYRKVRRLQYLPRWRMMHHSVSGALVFGLRGLLTSLCGEPCSYLSWQSLSVDLLLTISRFRSQHSICESQARLDALPQRSAIIVAA